MCLIKPFKQTELLAAILKTLNKTSPAQAGQRTRTRVDAAGADRPLGILLAEDNPINQLLGVRLLEKRGHTVVAVQSCRRSKEKRSGSVQRSDALSMTRAELPESPLWIQGDANSLRRLFLILLDNAVKYTSPRKVGSRQWAVQSDNGRNQTQEAGGRIAQPASVVINSKPA